MLRDLWNELRFWDYGTVTDPKKSLMGNEDLFSLMGHALQWLLAVIIVAAIMVSLYEACSRNRRKRIWNAVHHCLLPITIIAWVMGFLTYCVGTWVPGGPSFFSVVPMAIIHATGMFIMESDISAIRSAPHNSTLFMFFFNLSHFLAMLCSMAFVLHHFGFFLIRHLAIRMHSYWPLATDRNLYIMWGVNPNSLLLARDVFEKENLEKTIVFVRTYEDAESQSRRIGFQRFFDLIKLKDAELEQLHGIDCHVVSSFQRLSNLVLADTTHYEDVLGGMLRLRPLVRMIRRTTGTVNFIMLGDDSDSNIRAVVNLLKDKSIQGKDTHIYCHARKSIKNDFVEHYGLYHPEAGHGVKVHLVDSAYLSILDLKSRAEYQPVSMTEPTPMATVEKDFNALIVGFGETGEEAFRYLYEFASFVKADGSRTGFNCTVIDRRMDVLAGRFLDGCPGLRQDARLQWEKAEVGTSRFWDVAANALQDVNCVVLALNDDELQTNLMVQIFRKLCQQRTNDQLAKVKIFVRIYNGTSSSRITEFARLVRQTNQDDETLVKGFAGPEIVPFGFPEKIYVYDRILDDKVLRQAKDYNYNYQTVLAERDDISDQDSETIWRDCFEDMPTILDTIRQRNRLKAQQGRAPESTNRMLVVQDVVRQIEENISNSMHQLTKQALAAPIAGVTLDRTPATISYIGGTEAEKTLLLNLARCEHERWIASHILKGYVYGPAKDHRLKTHPDIAPWDTLDDYTKSYDCCVVDTTLRNYRN